MTELRGQCNGTVTQQNKQLCTIIRRHVTDKQSNTMTVTLGNDNEAKQQKTEQIGP